MDSDSENSQKSVSSHLLIINRKKYEYGNSENTQGRNKLESEEWKGISTSTRDYQFAPFEGIANLEQREFACCV